MSSVYLSFFTNDQTPQYGGDDSIRITQRSAISEGASSNSKHISMPNHVGTHIDFPRHFGVEGKTINDYPADFWTHDYYAQIDDSKCIGCGLCEKRCQVDAAKVIDNTAIIDLTRCIGCGLCVSTCNQNAIKLVPVDKPKKIHEGMDDFYEDLYKHKKGPLRTMFMALKLKKGKRWHS